MMASDGFDMVTAEWHMEDDGGWTRGGGRWMMMMTMVVMNDGDG